MDEESKSYFKFSEVIIIVLITCTFSIFAGISYGKIKYSNTININGISSDKDNEALNNFIKQYKYIISNYYDDSKIDEEQLLKVALQSILDELGIEDSYSTYMDDDDYNQLNISLNGTYEGIGIKAYKEKDDGYIVVSNIIENSPASGLNIRSGDYILSIDGKDTREMMIDEFSQYILKSEEKTFLLKTKRVDEEFNIKIEKSTIELESVTSKVIDKDGHKIGYISMTIFASNTYVQFKKQLNQLENEKIESLIIDLRGNTGGHLSEVTKILSLFLGNKRVIYQLQKNENKVKYYSNGDKDKEYPIIFLGNEYTASASEVFIISLKENLSAKLVGMKTYGKGTVQEMVNLSNGDQYKITTKKWLSPKGNWINDTKGINPDIQVQLDETYMNNPTEENDNQLKEALRLALEETEKNN